MRTVRAIDELRHLLAGPRRAGASIGFVPTMGYLHDGHLELVRRAREVCDEVVVSSFVNPSQFDDPADLAAYPRDEAADAALAASAGADLLFAPSPDTIYPPGFSTTVHVGGITEPLEGAHRSTAHFDGVTTVVTKLLNIVGPDVAYFGQKDAQQALVVRRLVRDLDIPVRIEVVATLRDADGLALSSRNVRLSADDRERALSLSRALRAAEDAVADGERDADRVRGAALAVLRDAAVELDYVELVSADTLACVDAIEGPVLLAVAARVGDVRLIDNAILADPDRSRPYPAATVPARSHA